MAKCVKYKCLQRQCLPIACRLSFVAGECCNRPSDGAINRPIGRQHGQRSIPNSFAKFSAITVTQGKPSDDSLCMHGSYWTTTASLQLFPARRSMRVAYSSTCAADYVEFRLA